MKSFAITCGLFLLMIAVIISNAIFVNQSVDDFIGTLNAADPQNREDCLLVLDGIRIKWEKEKNIIQSSVSHTKIDTVSDLLDSIAVYASHENFEEYEKTAALLINAFEELRLLEDLSAVNIL